MNWYFLAVTGLAVWVLLAGLRATMRAYRKNSTQRRIRQEALRQRYEQLEAKRRALEKTVDSLADETVRLAATLVEQEMAREARWQTQPIRQGHEHPRWPSAPVKCARCGEPVPRGSQYTADADHHVIHPWECVPRDWEQPPVGPSGVADG